LKRTLASAWRMLVKACALVGLTVALVTCTPLVRWWALQLAGPWTDARGDAMIVLTGNILGNGIIGETSYWRSAYAVMAWREGGWRQVIVSGGGGGASLPVGEAMKIFLEAGGVPPGAIVTDTQSLSTRGSALNLARILAPASGPPAPSQAPRRTILLTSDYHMFRAIRALRKTGVTAIPRPIPDASKRAGSWNLRWDVFQDLLIETTKIVYYWGRGWI
jgi:uncharacterized SAM-binding protein YcdF (DUF218 family)